MLSFSFMDVYILVFQCSVAAMHSRKTIYESFFSSNKRISEKRGMLDIRTPLFRFLPPPGFQIICAEIFVLVAKLLNKYLWLSVFPHLYFCYLITK